MGDRAWTLWASEEFEIWLEPEFICCQSVPSLVRPWARRSRIGRIFPTLQNQLIELGLASVQGETLRIGYPDFQSLSSRGIDAFEDLVPWAPFSLELSSTTGAIGRSDFGYHIRFFLGGDFVSVERRGCFVRRTGSVFRLDPQSYALVEAVEAFNRAPDVEKASLDAFIKFSEIKGLAHGVGAQLDRYLHEECVLVASRVALDIVVEDGTRISFAPKIEGADEGQLREAFFASDDVEAVYSYRDTNGSRVRVVLDDEQREVLRRMQRVRHLGGAERAEVLRNPTAVFDGVAAAVDLDPETFGPRVRGIGDFPFVAQPYLNRGTGIFDGPEGLNGPGTAVAGIRCSYADGREEDLAFETPQEIRDLDEKVREARRSGEGTVDFRGKSIVLNEAFVGALGELVEQTTPSASVPAPASKSRRFLLIYTNEEQLEYEEEAETAAAVWQPAMPRSYAPGIAPKQHQIEGIGWLQRCYLAGRKGTLLADDMGMGKTFQVLSFLAWLIERGDVAAGPDPERPPWKPILIVAPLVLVDNETWTRELARFFEHQGALFAPWTVLRAYELKKLRRGPNRGKETELGEAVLDLDRLCENRVLVTNYDTITNYQHSFARLKDRLSVVVTDEAQAYKIPSTKISHALKSLSPRFRIACTGTPVETRLLDVWNLFDFLQPGHLLGSASEFSRNFERGGEASPENVATLKERLRFGAADAFVLRRDKKELKDLPDKVPHVLDCPLSERQRQIHVDLIRRVRDGEHPLGVIQSLLQLYQHPGLVPRYEPMSPREAIDSCPKLQAVLNCLQDIRRRGEKALIFTRTLDMQAMLAEVMQAEFGLNVGIVNGASTTRGAGGRRSIIDRFRASHGFDVILLSPDVAGIGLTLTEANHVIHYGRWWNPAKEAQATDRAHRIGQDKEVHVYYPVAYDPYRDTDPAQAFETFDQKLHALLERRRALAHEFLAPVAQDEDLQKELMDDVLASQPTPRPEVETPPVAPRRTSWIPWRRPQTAVWEPATFAAALMQHESGPEVVVLQAPRAGSEGIDFIAVGEFGVRLVWIAKTDGEAGLDVRGLEEGKSRLAAFQMRHLAALKGTPIGSVVGTMVDASRSLRAAAEAAGLELVGPADLDRPSDSEVIALEATMERQASLGDLVAAVEREVRKRFPGAVPAVSGSADPEWLAALFVAPAFVARGAACGRMRLPDERVREIVRALGERGYRMTFEAMVQRLGRNNVRVRAELAALEKLLNVDAYPVFVCDAERGSVELNVALLRKQFGLPE